MDLIEHLKEYSRLQKEAEEHRNALQKFAYDVYLHEIGEPNKNNLVWYIGFEPEGTKAIRVKYGYGDDFQSDLLVTLPE